jgi:hypothetical protein
MDTNALDRLGDDYSWNAVLKFETIIYFSVTLKIGSGQRLTDQAF